ncbi:MAG: putative baseplate assembly protein [Gemmatimonadales bacterium]|nr:MAG: putative baseplate assembly protein [Gemmatimonadales bacterium]
MSAATGGRGPVRYTNRDYESLREALLDLARERLPEWTDHSPNDPGVVLLELFSAMGDVVLHYQDRLANESYLHTAMERRSVLHLLRLIGHELSPPAPATADLTLCFEADAAGEITITPGTGFETSAAATGTPVSYQYIRDALTIDRDALPTRMHDGELVRVFHPLPVVQVDEVHTDEILGSSDDTTAQRFRIPQRPVILSTLSVRVDEGAGPRLWQWRESLVNSRPGDRHYTVRYDESDTAWIEFGDGRYGRTPPRGRNNIRASYRTGGGRHGNVPARSITEPVGDIPELEAVFNERSGTGGRDAEGIEEAVTRAPRQFRSMGRAVTARDYEDHALAFGVGKALATAASWNRIALYIAPAGGGYPTETLKQDLRSYFAERRIVTSILSFRDPVYVPVRIEGELEVKAYYFADQVREEVEAAVRALMAFDRVRFGDRLYLSKVYEAVEAIEGVRGVTISAFERADAPAGEGSGRLEFAREEIPVAASRRGIVLAVTGGERDA